MSSLINHFDITTDVNTTSNATSRNPSTTVTLGTGYFNLTPAYANALLSSKARFNILTASPKANGFLGAKGIMGHIPACYTYLEHQFFNKVTQANQSFRIRIQEYTRVGWTFHAKGVWVYPSGSSTPTLTLIGSPNFGHRSASRDLETQLAIVTADPDLQRRLHQEKENLYTGGEEVTAAMFSRPDRAVKV